MKETKHQFTPAKKITTMFPSSRCLFSVVLLVFLVRLCDGVFIEKKVDLRITNDLGNGLDLNLHCKSQDDDLGVHVLASHQFFEFSFRPNFWSSTLYFCRFWWRGESHWFDIYVQNRDVGRCSKKCWWMIDPTGPCLLNDKVKRYTYCENWNDQQIQGSSQIGTGNSTARTSNDSEYLEGNEKRGK